MKQILFSKSILMGAALVAGTAMFTACSSDEVVPDNVNPTYDGSIVKTQFAINIPVAKNADKRLSEDIVQGQNDPTFRGMDKIKLIPFTIADANNNLVGTESFTDDAIMLEAIAKTGGLTNGAKFYTDVAIPVGTNHFLFYAEAARDGSIDDKTNGAIVAPTEFDNGDLLNNGLSLSNLNFSLKGIASRKTDIETYLVGILNGVYTTLTTNQGSNETLKKAATNLATMKAGSSDAILAEMQSLYDIVKTGGTAAETNTEAKIKEYFSESTGTLSYNTSANGYVAGADNYPESLGLPNGAAQVKFDSNFAYNTTDNSANFDTYVYPAALYYFVESKVGSSETTHASEIGSMSNWSEFINTNYSTGTAVTSTTQSVVLKDQIQYAVAQLAYNVKFGATELPDNQNIKRAVGTDNFKLKGILIGGQKGVNWKFEQNASDPEKTIYDPTVLTAITTTTNTTNFYSLALQTAQKSGTDQTVNFALEFENNGEAFYGVDGIVPQGGTFYLVGTLSTAGQSQSDYVFEKDHKTTANITITSLANAKYTIPDLRKTQLELGLSVDLTWQEGLTDNVTID